MKNDLKIVDKHSPGCLFQTFGIDKIFVYRPHAPFNKSGLRRLHDLDDDIRNNGAAYVFGANHEQFVFSEGEARFTCIKIAFDYTEGKFYFIFRPGKSALVFASSVMETRLRFVDDEANSIESP